MEVDSATKFGEGLDGGVVELVEIVHGYLSARS